MTRKTPDWLEVVLKHRETSYREAFASFSRFTQTDASVVEREMYLMALTRCRGLNAFIPYVAETRANKTRVGYIDLQFVDTHKAEMEGKSDSEDSADDMDNAVNLTLQVESVEVSRKAMLADSQANNLAANLARNDDVFETVFSSNTLAVKTKREHVESGRPAPLYLHVNGHRLCTSMRTTEAFVPPCERPFARFRVSSELFRNGPGLFFRPSEGRTGLYCLFDAGTERARLWPVSPRA